MELVADPTVLFLDEPTSGLDSSTSQEVCDSLRKVAEKGLTVVAVIHQPRYEIFRMFHDVLLLGKGGRTVYLGPSEEALPYFENLGFKCPQHTNPADFFMDVISGLVHREGDPAFKPEDLFRFWEEDKLNGGQEKRAMQGTMCFIIIVASNISSF
jgi:ABC-type multidrug transport system ATPase subunit